MQRKKKERKTVEEMGGERHRLGIKDVEWQPEEDKRQREISWAGCRYSDAPTVA